MSNSPLLTDSQWPKLLEYVAEAYNEVTLSRGFTLFKQQQVTALNVAEARRVQATVEEAETYKVALNLDTFSLSQCACPMQSSCKHLAAVMMELADRLGYPATQIMNAKLYLKRAADSNIDSSLQQLPNMDVQGWQHFLNQYASSIKPSYDQGIYVEALRQHLNNLNKVTPDFPAIDSLFFELHKLLFIFRKIKEQMTLTTSSYYTSSTIYRFSDEMLELLKTKTDTVNPAASSERIDQTLAYLREQMSEDSGQKYHDFGVYTALWKYWIAPFPEADRLLTQEQDNLMTLVEVSPSPSVSAARAYILLLQGKSDEAWDALATSSSFKELPAALFLTLLNQLAEAQQWAGLVTWLRKSAPFFNMRQNKKLEIYADFWKLAVSYEPHAEEQMWHIFEQFLPHSLAIIEAILYEQGKWKAWLEMQIVLGHDPFYHRVSVLQPIEKESPVLLLPYYHQAVDHYVSLKNRHDYKAATKLLKRLEKVYKKMKQPERWDIFFAGFIERYSRLRALQEELRKGKLMG
ncbi:SWIM zinc finger family protein [Paenibacillus alba]|uniref:SWIM-type domain-containing protein n=1 Tax=Paenibacillus alba TaxID=1197127 RepID=A0ABU6G5G2_9BACL|nr:hypothetical protein [Paenibacillus alba]MEC0229414.1 hypothetical protein [Paenibacillus alba]